MAPSKQIHPVLSKIGIIRKIGLFLLFFFFFFFALLGDQSPPAKGECVHLTGNDVSRIYEMKQPHQPEVHVGLRWCNNKMERPSPVKSS